jgi:hypothetical protein
LNASSALVALSEDLHSSNLPFVREMDAVVMEVSGESLKDDGERRRNFVLM